MPRASRGQRFEGLEQVVVAMGCHRPQAAFLSHRWGHFLGISAVGSPIAEGVFGEGWGGSCNWLVLSPSAPTTIPVETPPGFLFHSLFKISQQQSGANGTGYPWR